VEANWHLDRARSIGPNPEEAVFPKQRVEVVGPDLRQISNPVRDNEVGDACLVEAGFAGEEVTLVRARFLCHVADGHLADQRTKLARDSFELARDRSSGQRHRHVDDGVVRRIHDEITAGGRMEQRLSVRSEDPHTKIGRALLGTGECSGAVADAVTPVAIGGRFAQRLLGSEIAIDGDDEKIRHRRSIIEPDDATDDPGNVAPFGPQPLQPVEIQRAG
jgi:hypothetical protein